VSDRTSSSSNSSINSSDNPKKPEINPQVLQARLAAIIASSDDAIVGKDLNGIVQSWNASAERIFGFTAEEMIGQPITRIIPDDRLEEEPKILERLRRGERVDHFQTIRRRKDGSLLEVSVTISPIHDSTGRIVGASKIARDITALRRMERERDQLLESERAARLEAQRTSRLKDEFLATLSHELRTPLNAILGWAQLLRVGAVPAQELAQGLETIERNARVQARLIEELLDVSRIISGKLRLDVSRVDLGAVVEASIESVLPAADAKGVRIVKVLDSRAGPVSGDRARLQQVMWNLLSNAVKFTPRGGRVHVHVRRVESHIEVIVSDTGAGIKPEFLPHLFERFTQADSSTTRRHTGLGLGLAIVRHLVELHGGTVKAHSDGEGRGATFTLLLPLVALADDRSEESTEGAATQTQGTIPGMIDLSGVKVLVVDDEADARVLIRRVLEQCGATVVEAESAEDGVELLKRERPQVMLSDIGMPDRDGYHLLQQTRELPEAQGGRTPAVALTAFARSEDRRRALLSGFQMHVPKPVEPAELIAVVASLAGVATRRSTVNPQEPIDERPLNN
jgi:PAS domain S-box-containing protein